MLDNFQLGTIVVLIVMTKMLSALHVMFSQLVSSPLRE